MPRKKKNLKNPENIGSAPTAISDLTVIPLNSENALDADTQNITISSPSKEDLEVYKQLATALGIPQMNKAIQSIAERVTAMQRVIGQKQEEPPKAAWLEHPMVKSLVNQIPALLEKWLSGSGSGVETQYLEEFQAFQKAEHTRRMAIFKSIDEGLKAGLKLYAMHKEDAEKLGLEQKEEGSVVPR